MTLSNFDKDSGMEEETGSPQMLRTERRRDRDYKDGYSTWHQDKKPSGF